MTSAALWAEYVRSPDTHPHIPNVSYAGYRFSEVPLPEPAVVANVRTEGAAGNGTADDSAAFAAALAKARAAGGGAVLVPAGTYRLRDVLRLDASGLVLRGEGPEKSVLAFDRPLANILGRRTSGGKSAWSWSGGLVWIAPPEGAGPAAAAAVPLAKPARMGDRVVEVAPADAAKLAGAVGRTVRIRWTGDRSLALHIAGHPSMEAYDWSSWRELRDGRMAWDWPNRIEAVDGPPVALKKPLRLDAREGWEVTLGPVGPHVAECGVEGLTLRMPPHARPGHLKDPGFNGVYLDRAHHSWVRDVTIELADNGVILDRSSNCTVTGLRVTGGTTHHATMCRRRAHDNLIQHFRIESRPRHGINTEGTSSGNVWRRGVMLHGTFDSHCMMSFDLVRTAIEVRSDGSPGGARDHGPFLGRRAVHWNVRLTGGKNEWVFGPAYMPTGAIVGGRGGPVFTRDTGLWHMPDGPKGCLVVDHGTEPTPPDLFEAQLRLRLGAQGAATDALPAP
jgi:hypothetical protein